MIVVGSTNWTTVAEPIREQLNANMIDYLLGWHNEPRSGDYDGDGLLTILDLDRLLIALYEQSQQAEFDLDHSGVVDTGDRDVWVHTLAEMHYGDANLDGQFDSYDLVLIFQSGEYEDQVIANSTWATGDWSGDREFSSQDLVLALQDGGYTRQASPPAVAEPTAGAQTAIGLFALAWYRRATRSSLPVFRPTGRSPLTPFWQSRLTSCD
jgi:hypothetical protein